MEPKIPAAATLEAENRICKNCANEFNGKFCNRCGEKVIDDHERTIVHFLEGIFHIITHADAKIFRNMKLMLLSPGALTKNFVEGIRQKYMKPIPMFFVANLIYFLFPLFETFNTSFQSQMRYQDYSDKIKPLALEKMKERNITEPELARLYNAKTKTLSKLMLIIFVPAFAMVLAILHIGKKGFFADHLVMGLEFMSYTLFFNTILLSFLMALAGLIAKQFGWNTQWLEDETILLIPVLVISTMYFLIRAERTFYQQRWVFAVLKSVAFLLALAYLVTGYRFLLFHITIRTI